MSTATTPTPTERAEAFRAARVGAGLDIRPLASRVGLSHSTISRWERGEREIAESTYHQLIFELGSYMAGRWAA